MGYPRNMSNFLRVLYSYIEAYFRYAFLYTNKDQSRPWVFKNLIIKRSKEFVVQTGCQASGVPGKSVREVRDHYLLTLSDKVIRIGRELWGESEGGEQKR